MDYTDIVVLRGQPCHLADALPPARLGFDSRPRELIELLGAVPSPIMAARATDSDSGPPVSPVPSHSSPPPVGPLRRLRGRLQPFHGHIFQERLHYSQFQVNGVASAASIASYLPVPLMGYVCDRAGPAPLSLAASVLFGAGYGLAAGLHKKELRTRPRSGRQGLRGTATIWSMPPWSAPSCPSASARAACTLALWLPVRRTLAKGSIAVWRWRRRSRRTG